MAKDIVLNVVARKNSKDLVALADEFEALKKATDDSGKSLQKHATFSAHLDDQLEKTRKQVHDLGLEFDRTGNKDVFANLRGAEANLKKLENIKKQLSTSLNIDIGDNNNSGGTFFSNFGKNLKNLVTGSGLSGVKAGDSFSKGFVGAAGDALTAAAPALAPALVILVDEALAVVGGAVTAGIGAAGLAVGIAGAFQDPQVKQAAGSLGTTLKGTLTEVGKDFVDPVRTAILDLDQAAFRGSDQVAAAFKPLANAILPLEKGIEGLVSSALPGLRKGFANAEPVIEQVAKELPGLGRAVGDAIEKISSNINENKAAIQFTFQLIDKTIEGLGTLLSTAEKVFGGFIRAVQPIAHFDKAVFGWLPLVGDQVHHASDQVDALNKTLNESGQAQGAAATAATAASNAYYDQTHHLGDMRSAASAVADAEARLTAEFDSQVNKLLTLEGTSDAYQKGLNDLGDALSKNTHSLRGNSDDVIQNREAIRNLIAQAEQARQAAIDHAGGVNASSAAVKAANDVYEQNLQKLEALGVQLGLRKADLDAIVGEYDINIVATVSGNGKGIVTQGSGAGAVFNVTGKGLKLRAAGGPVEAGQPYIVGESRPELFVPNQSGYIMPKVPSGWGAQSRPQYNVVLAAKDGALEALLSLIDVRVDQANHQTAAAVAGGPRL